MADVHDRLTRSRNMSAVRAADTKPEMIIRRGLHAKGLRYRLHAKDLKGRPDIVLPRHNAVIFVHGCFFHGHDCHLFKWPRTNPEFWRRKIQSNTERDAEVLQKLATDGWRIGTVWECALKGKTRLNRQEAIDRLAKWISSDAAEIVLEGEKDWSPQSGSSLV